MNNMRYTAAGVVLEIINYENEKANSPDFNREVYLKSLLLGQSYDIITREYQKMYCMKAYDDGYKSPKELYDYKQWLEVTI